MEQFGSSDCGKIMSYTCRCIIAGDTVRLLEPSPRMQIFYGDSQSDMLRAPEFRALCAEHAARREDFRAAFSAVRADGSRRQIRAEACCEGQTEEGAVYSVVCMDLTELPESGQAAERLAAENRALLEDSPVGLGIYHIRGSEFRLVYTNAEYYRVHHGSREYWDSFRDKSALERILPEDAEIIRSEWKRVLQQGQNETFDASYRCRGEDGKIHWVRLLGRISGQTDGMYTCYASYLDLDREKSAVAEAERLNRDLTGTALMIAENEQKLAKQYSEQQAYLDSPGNSYLLTMRVNISTDEVEAISGTGVLLPGTKPPQRYADFLGLAAQVMPHREDREALLRHFSRQALLSAHQAGERTAAMECYASPDGRRPGWIRLQMNYLKRPGSEDVIAFGTLREISDEVIYRELTNRIVESNYENVSYLDLFSGQLFVKAAHDDRAFALDKLAYGEALDRAVKRWVRPAQAEEIGEKMSAQTVKAALEKSSVYTVYYNIRRGPADSAERQIKNDAFYLDDNRNVIVFLLSDVTDVFERERENREKMAQALAAAEQASLAKTEFLSRMSHEIRTPMNAIIGLDAIALQEEGLTSSMVDHLQKIGISARFLLSLINDILDMSRIESGRMALRNEPFNFEEMIGGINTILYEQCRDSGLDYDCVLKSWTEETYVGDVTKLQQVLINLLGNAVKFTPSGGKVHFMIQQISRTKERARLRFEISDTGIGIDDRFLPQLFEPFTQENRGRTSAYGGTGLGLAISRNIVQLMNGEIAVHSIKNVGSEFTVELELGLTKESVRRRELGNNLKPLFTLIVDDDVIVCQHTQMLLSDAGLRTEYVDSGAGAVKKVEAQHKARADYDLVLLDWQMPDMDGIETAREIRKIVGPEVTIIIMTAYDWADIEKRARAAGVDLFMKKPIFASSVTRAFENVLQRKADGAEQEAGPEYDFRGRRILLAEDNEINAEIARSLLEMKGCEVETAANGAEAVESFAAAPAGRFDAILMDVRMPVMDGLDAARAIRAMRKADARTVPIFAMTANAFQEDVNMSLEAGMNAHMTKPIEPITLYETLQRYFK